MKIVKKIKSESGFTLIELLVVIGIIAILATIGAVNFSSARAKARDAKRIADLKQIQSSVEVEAAGTASGLYPSEATLELPIDIVNLSPPRTSDSYCYGVSNDGTTYTVAAIGMEDEDNAAGGAGTEAAGTGTAMTISDGSACTIDCTPPVGTDDETYCLTGSSAS